MCFGVSGKESEAPGGPARGGRLGQALVSQRLFTCDGTRAGTTVRSNGTFSTGTPAHERVKTSRTARRPKPGGRSYRPPSTAIRGCETMTDLLFQPSPARGPNDYEVIADDWIVGRIVLSDASPAERPWMWSLDHEFYQGRERTYGYEATREAAMRDEGTKRAAVHGRACERRPHEFVRSEDERNRGRPRQRTGGGTRP